MKKIVTLPDGYNGDTVKVYSEPVETDGLLVKLQVVDSYMIRWIDKTFLANYIRKSKAYFA